MKTGQLLLKSILAGLCIGLGGIMYISIENKVLGAFMFTLGLFTICAFKFHLFTGRVGYLVNEKLEYAVSLIYTWIGNLIGTGIIAFLMLNTDKGDGFMMKATNIAQAKLDSSYSSAFILAIFCGMLMFIAVNNFKNNPHELGKYLGLFVCVAGFILCGFEHCIANMFYFSAAKVWGIDALLKLFVMTIGNSLGGVLIPLANKVLKD